jgi:hypothetical protein
MIVLGVMLTTERSLAIGWDEGYTLGREARLRLWFRALIDPATFASTWVPPEEELVQQKGAAPPTRQQVDSRLDLFTDPQTLAWFWPFAREEPHGHPPFYAILGLLGDAIAPQWNDLSRARLGPILLFSLTAGVLVNTLVRRWGLLAGIVAGSAWLLQPRLFAEGHFATYDGILTSLWVLAILIFLRATETKRNVKAVAWMGLWGIVVGCAMATKLTGWFLPLPFLAWIALDRNRRWLWLFPLGGMIAGLVLLTLNPPWWTDPINGLFRFFESNLTRGHSIPIKVLFLGRVYNTPIESLPWYNTLVWVGLVTPVGFLLLFLLGCAAIMLRRCRDPLATLLVLHFALLIGLRSLPHTPGHDGVRLFLPAFGVLALICGLGAKIATSSVSAWGRLLVAGSIAEGVISLVVMMPVPLSYYSPLVGGLPGAAAIGMEPTYYWDALGVDIREWLARNTPEGETIQFATFPHSFLYLRRIDELPHRIAPIDPGEPVWYVLQNRPGSFFDLDRNLLLSTKPVYTVSKLGVPLIWVFRASDVVSVPRTSR